MWDGEDENLFFFKPPAPARGLPAKIPIIFSYLKRTMSNLIQAVVSLYLSSMSSIDRGTHHALWDSEGENVFVVVVVVLLPAISKNQPYL